MTRAYSAVPVYFGDPGNRLFGWLHAPPRGSFRSVAVAICNPFGHEALSSHRTIRSLADSLSAAGVVALRFDYEGTGNSAGDSHRSHHADAWRRSIQEAHRFLSAVAPGSARGLIGLRLGSLLALDFARLVLDTQFVVLIAPPRNGRQHLRELRALHSAAGLASSLMPAAVDELFGFPLPSNLKRFIESLDLASATASPTPEIYAIDRAEMPLGTQLADALRGQAARLEIRSLPGISALLADPHDAEIPRAIVDQTVQWICRRSPPPQSTSTLLPAGAAATEHAARIATADGGDVFERACLLNGDARLFGILTTPTQTTVKQQLVLASSGANPTPGPNRLYVSLARQLAPRGVAVLRMDVEGIGDSQPRLGDSDHVVYATHAPEDVARAAEFLAQLSPAPVTAGGICSGGYHALKAASAGAPLAGLTIINPLTFSYVEGAPLSARPFSVIGEARRYNASLRSMRAWRKLVTGRVDIRNIIHVYGQRLRGRVIGLLREALHRSPWAMADDVGRQLEELTRRGVKILFVFATDDPGPRLLKEFGGSAARRLQREHKIRIVTIDDSDHTFTLLRHQDALAEALRQYFVPASTPSRRS